MLLPLGTKWINLTSGKVGDYKSTTKAVCDWVPIKLLDTEVWVSFTWLERVPGFSHIMGGVNTVLDSMGRRWPEAPHMGPFWTLPLADFNLYAFPVISEFF